MIKIKLTTDVHIRPLIFETPDEKGIWNNCQFFINDDVDDCDYWVVYQELTEKKSVHLPAENTIFIAAESSSIKEYNQKFLNQFSHIITCQRKIKHPKIHYMAPGLSWFSKKNYDELISLDKIKKNKLISVVVSNKSWTPGHKSRLEFCLNLKNYFGDKIDIFGRGINGFDDKWDTLAPYKYSIAIENNVETDWMTEKIGDCFTSLTFPFYYGCPNINDYYSPDSYELIDINDFNKSCKIIEGIINNKEHYEQHLNNLIESKNKYLNQYCLIPLIANFIEDLNKRTKSSQAEIISLKPEIKFENIIKKTLKILKNKIKHE